MQLIKILCHLVQIRILCNQNNRQKLTSKNIITKIEKNFLNKALYKSKQIILFPKEVISQIIEECKKQNIRILAIDGYYIRNIMDNKTEIKIQPNMMNSIEFDDDIPNEETYKQSFEFLTTIKDERLCFEIDTNS